MFSAVHPTTDIAKILRHVRFVPTAEVDVSLNHFVSASPQRWWHRTTESVWPSDAQLCCQFQDTDQRWRFLSTSSARSACTVITNSLLITSSTVRSVSITNVTRCRSIIGIHPLTPNCRATT